MESFSLNAPSPVGGPMPRLVHSRPGVDNFSLGLSLITIGFQLALDEISPMSRNIPEQDVGRSRVVRPWSPSLGVVKLAMTRIAPWIFGFRHSYWQQFQHCFQVLVTWPRPPPDP